MSEQNEAIGFLTTGATAGIGTAVTVGNVGVVGSVSFGVGTMPIVGAGVIAGAAAYGAVAGIRTGDAVALGAAGIGAIGGMGAYSAIGGIGIAGSFGAVGVGLGTMAAAGGVVGLGVYGLAKILDKSAVKEPVAQVFARMESKILAQEAYIAAWIELDDFLYGNDIKRRCDELELEDELDKLKAKLQRQSMQQIGVISSYQTLIPGAVLSLSVAESSRPQKSVTEITEFEADPGTWLRKRALDHHDAAINAIAISPDHQTVATASDDKTIVLWNLNTGKRLYTFYGQREPVLAIAFSPDGQTLVSGGIDQIITSWNLATKSVSHIFLPAYATHSHHSLVQALAFSPDGQTLASGSADNTIRIWRSDHRSFVEKLKRTLHGHTDTVFSVAIAPDQHTLVSSSADQTMRIWNLQNWKPPLVLTGHQSWINSVAISPDSKMIISGSADNTIKLWNLATGELIQTLVGHTAAVISIAISPDGKTIASSSNDQTIRLWSLKNQTAQGLHTLAGCGKVIFSADSQTLICAGKDGLIKVFGLSK